METATKSNGVAMVNGHKPKQLKPVPKLQDIVNTEVINSDENELQVILNQDPPDQWIKTHEFVKNWRYIPTDKIELMLTRIFIKWWVEVLDYKLVANSLAVHVRLFYVSPITGETLHQDGVGAAPLQIEKGYGAIDFNYMKSGAAQMALPSAKTYAIKDAAELIGRVFGRDLNRKDLMGYENLSGRYAPKTPDQIARDRMISLIKEAESKERLSKLKVNIKEDWQDVQIEYNLKLDSFA